MANFCVLLFNETTDENYPGVPNDRLLDELPVWMEFRIRDILQQEEREDIPFIPFLCKEKSDLFSLVALLENRKDTRTLILRRTGNAVRADWENINRFTRNIRGIAKVQVGSVPSDMYIISREQFVRLMLKRVKREGEFDLNFTEELFNGFLFRNFERIVQIPGRSFLFRNVYEYFRENLRIREYFLDNGFLGFYSELNNTHTRGATIAEGGAVKNSMIGSGALVEGLVEDSVIFHDVHVAPGAVVRGSVILPSNTVDTGTQIINTVVLEGKERIIGCESSIGKFSDNVNIKLAQILKKGLTVIGEGIDIPPFSRIGSGCLVCGNSQGPLEIEDGSTFNQTGTDSDVV